MFCPSGNAVSVPEFKDGIYLATWNEVESEERLRNFLATMVKPDIIVCMALHFSGERYYKSAVPYLEALVDQRIIADLAYGESWALLGYKGTPSPVPHWRKSVRRKMALGPSKIAKLVTLRKG